MEGLVIIILIIIGLIYFKEQLSSLASYSQKRMDVYVLEREPELTERANVALNKLKKIEEKGDLLSVEDCWEEFQQMRERQRTRHNSTNNNNNG